MRLCGISSRFQLLSPCIRQVTHALLTRPPLSQWIFHPKTSVSFTPFDLHVLSTPPAFILSQDQTLMFNLCFRTNVSFLFPFHPLLSQVMVTVFRFVFLDAFSITLKEFSRLHYCLIFKVLRCCFVTALIFYHAAFILSTTFLFFYFAVSIALDSLLILPSLRILVNSYFKIF